MFLNLGDELLWLRELDGFDFQVDFSSNSFGPKLHSLDVFQAVLSDANRSVVSAFSIEVSGEWAPVIRELVDRNS